MRRKSILSVVLASVIILTMVSGNASVYAKVETKRQIVVFEENVDNDKKTEILEKHKASKIKDIKGTNAVVISVSSDNNVSNESDVRFVEDDYIISIEGSTSKKVKDSDDNATDQPAEVVPWGVEYMNDLTSDGDNTGAGIKVGIIDTGIDVDHPDLNGNIKGGYNATSKKKSFDDDNGHGTHVAGIIAAVDNDIGVVGVAPDAELYAVKALDSTGNGYISDVIEGIEWCIANNIDIINMSISIEADSNALHETVIEAYCSGIIMVAAAGNNYGDNCEFPAAYDEVIGVGALDINVEIAMFSAKNGVDVWAPGVEIFSTYYEDTYLTMNGTSMAAPHWIKQLIKINFTEDYNEKDNCNDDDGKYYFK